MRPENNTKKMCFYKFVATLLLSLTHRTAKILQTNRLEEVTKPLSQNSKVSYFNKLRACINQAFEDRIIPHNPLRGIEGFKQAETERSYLTLEEVKAMAVAHCKYPALKNAFMFSCLTGLRKSDIEKLRWREVQQQGDFTRIIFKQKKTGGQEYLDINKQAVQYMGVRREPDDRVFVGFKYSAYMIAELRMWANRAGITKDITFHSGRHTFAVLMLDLGAEIYTVQKLLGKRYFTRNNLRERRLCISQSFSQSPFIFRYFLENKPIYNFFQSSKMFH